MADTGLVLRDSLHGWLINTRFAHVAYTLDLWDDVNHEFMVEDQSLYDGSHLIDLGSRNV